MSAATAKNEEIKRKKRKRGTVKCTESVMRKCFYGGICGNKPCCDYIILENHSRGCSHLECDKFEERKGARPAVSRGFKINDNFGYAGNTGNAQG